MSLQTLAAQVEKDDPDRYAAAMAAPRADREALWTLYALNLEIARAPWASNEPMVAEMRLQWWIDALARLGGDPAPNAALTSFLPLAAKHAALAELFHDAAEARRWDAWREPFESEAEFAGYIDATAGNVMWAAALVLGAPVDAEACVRDLAWGAGLANWLRAIPALEAAGRFPLPDGRPEAVVALAREGRGRIARARAARGAVPARAVPALLPGWQADTILAQAASDPSRVSNGTLGTSEARRRASLAWRAALARW